MPGSKTKHFFEVDDTFANYTIVNFCGSGTYGEVYLAEDITHKLVALKVLPITGGSRVWQMELLGLRHYRQAIEDHKALIEVLHVGETENFFYYTMEAADNMLHGDSDEYIADTLSHRLERGGRLEPEKVLELANTQMKTEGNITAFSGKEFPVRNMILKKASAFREMKLWSFLKQRFQSSVFLRRKQTNL